MGDRNQWPFETDARRNDPLTVHRIAVTSSHPRWSYLVAFDSDSAVRPTDAEVAQLASFLAEYKHHWYGDNGYRRQMEERLLDVDGGANGVVFHKWGEDDWGYRRHSYTMGPLFFPGPPHYRKVGPFSLAALMDFIHTFGDDKPMQRWLDWKTTHSDAFPAGA